MLTKNIKEPSVAGRFYPKGKESLRDLIHEIFKKEEKKIDFPLAKKEILGAVLPHAGYVYSAYQAVHFFALLKHNPVETFIIVNPNHTGYGDKIALDKHQAWGTPLGNVEQDEELIDKLDLTFSNIAHENEHSGEVMLPLLKYFVGDNFKVVMITLSQQNSQNAAFLAKKIDLAAKTLGRKIMLIASSDFTHFKDAETSKYLDDMVLQQIKNKNIEQVEQVVRQNNISVCGFGPIMCLMEYSKLQGDYESKVIARGHSGEVSHSDKVVNYINILFYKAQNGSPVS